MKKTTINGLAMIATATSLGSIALFLAFPHGESPTKAPEAQASAQVPVSDYNPAMRDLWRSLLVSPERLSTTCALFRKSPGVTPQYVTDTHNATPNLSADLYVTPMDTKTVLSGLCYSRY